MKCPLSYGWYSNYVVDCPKAKCAWYDEKKKQCCIKTLAQKDNSKVSIAR